MSEFQGTMRVLPTGMYCRACAVALGSEDRFQLETLPFYPGTEFRPWVTCRECGVTQVDEDGWCLAETCLLRADPRHRRSELPPPPLIPDEEDRHEP